MNRSTAFVLDKFPWDKGYTIRIVIPGIDDGSAVWLEHVTDLKTKYEAERLLDRIMAELRNVERE